MIKLKELNEGNIVKESKSGRFKAMRDYYIIKREDFLFHEFMIPIEIDRRWCEKLGFEVEDRMHESGNYDWLATKGSFHIKSLDDEVVVILSTGGVKTLLEHIKYLHQLQNFYYLWHNEELTIN